MLFVFNSNQFNCSIQQLVKEQEGGQPSFPSLFFSVFDSLAFTYTLILFLFYVSTMGRRKEEGAQARTGGKGGQAGGRGQEQGAGRSGVTGCADKLEGGGRRTKT